MNRIFRAAAISASFILLAAGAAAAQADPAKKMESAISVLIGRIVSDRPAVSEKAMNELTDMGMPAMAELRMRVKSTDERVRAPAALALGRLGQLDDKQRKEMRSRAQEAFASADYKTMGRLYARLAFVGEPSFDDCLWAGHARQLAQRWKRAVAAYLVALDRIDHLIKHPPPPPVVRPGREVERIQVPDDPRRKEKLLMKRSGLILLIGKLQRAECRDPDAAAATFASAADHSPSLNRPLKEMFNDYLRKLGGQPPKPLPWGLRTMYVMNCLREVASCKEGMGQHADALTAWNRVNVAALLYRTGGRADITAMVRLAGKLPPGKPMPWAHGLIPLSPMAPNVALMPEKAETRALAYKLSSNRNTPHWKFALVPPPDKEFATIEFACDIEQGRMRHGGHFSCSAVILENKRPFVKLGGIGYAGAKPGRKVSRQTFRIPPGSAAVSITTGSWREKGKVIFIVHRVEAKATFRPRGKPDVKVQAEAWIQHELLPPGGRATRNGKRITARPVASTLHPGRYAYTYQPPGRKDIFRCELKLEGGRRYGLFVNLDSPFKSSLTALGDFDHHPPARGCLARLADGRWLAAWCATGHKIMLSTSKALLTWAKPYPLPFNSVFRNVAPALLADADGTVHMAYFSNRLHLESSSSAGYLMWLTSSKDGRRWSAPRVVQRGSYGGWPLGAAQMLRMSNLRYLIFWRQFVASGKSLADIRRLSQIKMNVPDGVLTCNPHVTFDAKRQMHMVFDNFSRGIYHSVSADGTKWSAPKPLLPRDGPEGQGTSHPQLIIRGGRAALMYETLKGGFLRSMALKTGKLGPVVKITHNVIPLSGSRLRVTPDGQVVILAGADTVWVLRAPLKDVLAERKK